METYTIKPFTWTPSRDGKILSSDSAMGGYTIEIDGSRVSWRYCFDEFYDEESFFTSSVEEAKEEAFASWVERIKHALVPVGPRPGGEDGNE